MSILYHWKICARYEDGYETIVSGNDEDDCMWKILDLTEKHGECTWYSGYCDENYVDGEYIGRENFIYE